MPEWWSYSLADAQIFSAVAYDRLVERCMQQVWPAQALAFGLGVAAMAWLMRRPASGARALATLVALANAAVAAWWLPHCLAELHWASGFVAAGFVLQALLLAAAVFAPAAWVRAGSPSARACTLALFAFALAAIPWLTLPAGATPWRAEVVGLMPAPTIAASFALLPLCSKRWRIVLVLLPLAGTAFEALTLASIGRTQWLLLPLLVLALAALLLTQRAR